MHFSKAITVLYFLPAAAVVTRNQRKIMVVRMGGHAAAAAGEESRSGAVIFFTAGTNHYHFPDHALCGNSPPYSLNLSRRCQSQRTN